MIVDLVGHRPTAIRSFQFTAGDFSGEGRARFGPDGKLAEATFDRVALGRHASAPGGHRPCPRRLDIHVAGGVFDAEPFIEQAKLGAGHAAASSAPPAPEKPTRPFLLTADRLDRVVIGPGREIDGVRLSFDYDGLHWHSVDAEGSLPGGKPMTFRWLPADGATHQLSIVADDAGAALKVMGIFDNAVGGRLTITGSTADADPKRAIKGHAEVTEYRLIRQPALLRLFSMAMFTGWPMPSPARVSRCTDSPAISPRPAGVSTFRSRAPMGPPSA